MFKSFFDTLNSGYELPPNTSIVGTDLFSMGNVNDFRIQTNLDTRTLRDIASQLNGFSNPISLSTLNTTSDIVTNLISNNTQLILNYDRGKLTNYAYFGSLSEFIRVSIQNILSTFPASLYITNQFNPSIQLTVLNYSYDSGQNVASMQVPVSAIVNNYGLFYSINTNLLNISTNLKDITSNFTQYVIWNFSQEFPILTFTGSTNPTTGYLYLTVTGNPFPNLVGSSGLINYHIKPNYMIFETFIDGLEDFQAYLLNRDTIPQYTAAFKSPQEAPDGNTVLVNELFTWTTTDGYNLDYNSYNYQTYLQSLLDLGHQYDEYKSNLISRFLTTAALKEFDTPDKKMHILLHLYGREFDEIKIYINELANIAKTSYDKKDNIPDILIKNFAKTLGWGTFNTVNGDINSNTLMQSFLGNNQTPIFSGQSKNLTPVETDIELWRRLVINSAYLFKSKGTRNCINFLFKIIGAPSSLIDFDEYVYLVDNKINVSAITNNSDLNYPFDENGNPIVLTASTDYYFQMKGGWISNVEIAPNNNMDLVSIVGIHTGDYDNGQSYFDVYKNFGGQPGFQLTKTVDNVKSWPYSTGATERVDVSNETDYSIQNSLLILNTKETSIFLDPAKAIEYDVYYYNYQNDFPVNNTEMVYPYPNTVLTRAEVTNLTFLEYVDFIYSNYINVKNRKVISNNNGGGYPTLQMIYWDYFYAGTDFTYIDETSLPPSNQLDFQKIQQYLNLIDGFWIPLIEQFIPSTTIWQGGIRYRNTVFERQKYVYRHGIDDGSEFVTKQMEPFQDNIPSLQISGKVGLPYTGNGSNGFQSLATYTSSISFNSGGTNSNASILDYKPDFQGNILTLVEPSFIMTEVTKIQTGMTEPIIHNITNGLKTVDFIFTGNTSYFNLNNNPFSTFTYSVYPYNYTTTAFTIPSTYDRTLTELSAQTASTRTINETIKYPFSDGDYLIRGSYYFSGTTGSNVLPSSYTINNLNVFNSPEYYQYGLYDKTRDYWFTIISNPPIPVINTSIFGTAATQFSGVTLVNDILPVTASAQTTFIYAPKPVGDVILNANGNNLIYNADYTIDNTTYLNAIIITLTNPLSNLRADSLNIIYISNDNGVAYISTESQVVSSIPSGTGGTIGDQIYFNTNTGNYEYYFDFTINVNVDFNQIIATLNGNTLIINQDYYLSPLNQSAIVFAGVAATIHLEDVLVFYYPNTDLPVSYILNNGNFTAMWSSSNSGRTGYFTVQIVSGTDVNFTTILYSGTTQYISGVTNYSLYMGDLNTPNLSYLYRVISTKQFTDLLGETFTTMSFSTAIPFSTNYSVVGT